MDRLTSLMVFTRVADAAGFAAAARRLGMSSTMVSTHVQTLEARLGARLFNRSTRRVSLTEVGRAYYERCTRILAELEEADRAAGALQSTPRGTLRLFANGNILRFLAPVISEYMASYPEVTVDLSSGERAIDLVEEGYDLAINTTLPADSSLVVRRLMSWHHVVCCAPGYLQDHEAPRHPEDLAGHNCLRYTYYAFGDEWRFLDPDGGLTAVRVGGTLLSHDSDVLRQAALAGRGVFLAPTFVAADDLAAGRLVALLPDYRGIEFTVNALYPHRLHLSAKVRSFLDLLAGRVARQSRWAEA